jgi:hypothetical protein
MLPFLQGPIRRVSRPVIAWRSSKTSTKAGFRRIIDARLGFTLRHHGVNQLATVNTKDFQEFGFQRVWNPLSGSP